MSRYIDLANTNFLPSLSAGYEEIRGRNFETEMNIILTVVIRFRSGCRSQKCINFEQQKEIAGSIAHWSAGSYQ